MQKIPLSKNLFFSNKSSFNATGHRYGHTSFGIYGTTIILDFVYLGCFVDDPINRQLSHGPLAKYFDECWPVCYEGGFAYFGYENTNELGQGECFCGRIGEAFSRCLLFERSVVQRFV